MAAKKPKNPPAQIDPYLDDRIEESEFAIDEFMEEWGPLTSVVEILRMRKDGSRPHIDRVGIEILREDLPGYLRENHGEGKYLLVFKNAQRRVVKNLVIDIEVKKPVAPGTVSTQGPTDYNRELMLALIAAIKPQQGPDLGALLTGMAAMMTAMKPSTPGTDPAAMLAAVSSTFANLKSAAGNNDDWLEKVQKLVSVARELNPGEGGGGGDSWPGLIKEIGGKVLEGLKPGQAAPPNGRQQAQLIAQPVQIVPTVPTVPIERMMPGQDMQPVPANPVTEDTPDMLREKWLRAQLAFLKQKALAGKDVEFWVDYILENQEEPGNQAILYALDQGATFQHLLTFDPEIGKNPVLAGWFQQFYESLYAALNEDVDSTGKGGDAPDPGGDAKPSS